MPSVGSMSSMGNREKVLWLDSLLELKRQVVGVRFLSTREDFDNSPFPLSKPVTYCTAIRNGTRGKASKLDMGNIACQAAARALGMVDADDYVLSGRRHADMGLYRDVDVSRSIAEGITLCERRVTGVEIAPLEDYTHQDPDIIIIIANPYTSMRISQGNAYHHGHLMEVKISGMQGVCQECTSYPYEKGELNISMLCSGTRCVSQWEKDELGLGLPYHLLDDLISGLQNTLNPMENNEDKKRIEAKLKENHLVLETPIAYNSNYYRGGYGTLEQLEMKKNKKK